ncbi:hypothetical protein ACWGE0_12045 [Lentzea sp. NPDC054927]
MNTLRVTASNDIGVNMNATIKYLLGRTLDPILGPERTDYQWSYRSALDLGVQAAVLREGRFGGIAGEAERITVPRRCSPAASFTMRQAARRPLVRCPPIPQAMRTSVCATGSAVARCHRKSARGQCDSPAR